MPPPRRASIPHPLARSHAAHAGRPGTSHRACPEGYIRAVTGPDLAAFADRPLILRRCPPTSRSSLALLAACGSSAAYRPTPSSDEFYTIESNAYGIKAIQDLEARAPFEMDCPKEQLVYKKLGSVHAVGVTGCNRKAVYKLVPYTGWVLNTAITTAPAADPPPAAAPAEAAPAEAAPAE